MNASRPLITGLLLMVLMASVPVHAQESYYVSGHAVIEPKSFHFINFTWFDVEYAIGLTFFFTTGNSSDPLYVYVENVTYVYEYLQDYMGIIEWTGVDIPTTEEFWWFCFYNRYTTKSVNVTYSLTYDNALMHGASLGEWVLLGLFLTIMFFVGGIYYLWDSGWLDRLVTPERKERM